MRSGVLADALAFIYPESAGSVDVLLMAAWFEGRGAPGLGYTRSVLVPAYIFFGSPFVGPLLVGLKFFRRGSPQDFRRGFHQVFCQVLSRDFHSVGGHLVARMARTLPRDNIRYNNIRDSK